MTFKDFIMDRLLYVFIFLANTVLVLAVFGLSFLQTNETAQAGAGNTVYIFVLSTVGLFIFLTVDYLSKKAYYDRLARIIHEGGEVETPVMLSGAVNREQQAVQHFMDVRHRLYTDQLTLYRQRQEHHHYFMNQWVHHMKTPVSVIGLLIQQSHGVKSAAQAGGLFQSIQEENERLAHGLEMILQMARLERFELDVHIKRVDLNELIRSVINDNKKACIRQAVYPKLESGEPLMEVETDEKWIRFVFNQLTVNAIKYSRPPGMPAAPEETDAKQLLFQIEKTKQGVSVHITDEGIGIPPQDVPRVFDAFFTGENGRASSTSTGMGLFLAKQVCGRLGHRLTVRSSQGEGSTFTVAFSSGSIHRDVMQPD